MRDYGDAVLTAQPLRLKKNGAADSINGSIASVPRALKELVLVIDDSAAMIDVLTDILDYLGCDVASASNGQDGLTAYEQQHDKVSLVILDMNMPTMNGEETLKGLRAINPDVKVIISSGISEAEARQRCVEQDQELPYFLPKPYDLATARALIRATLHA